VKSTRGVRSGRLLRPLLLVAAFATLSGAGTVSAAPVPVAPKQELVALLRSHQVRAAPTARSALVDTVPATTPITGEQTVLPLLARRGQWLRVRLPGRPNSHTGWIARAATTRFATSWHLVVNRSNRRVTVYFAGRSVRSFLAVVGKPSTPTPAGQFFVEESIALTPGEMGAPFALALSARSDVLQEFDGGPGQIALHGLSNVGGVPGTAVSHGCVRLEDSAISWLAARIGPGVPVTVMR